MERTIKRGDIFYADLNPIVGSEQGGRRPVLITSRVHTKAKLPTHTEVGSFEGLDKNSLILAEQIRTIDKRRLENYIGRLPESILPKLNRSLAVSIDLAAKAAATEQQP